MKESSQRCDRGDGQFDLRHRRLHQFDPPVAAAVTSATAGKPEARQNFTIPAQAKPMQASHLPPQMSASPSVFGLLELTPTAVPTATAATTAAAPAQKYQRW